MGEVEFLINYMAAYNVKTIFISGDDILMKELEVISGIKNISKSLEETLSFDEHYYQYVLNINKALILLGTTIDSLYSNKKIKIKFM